MQTRKVLTVLGFVTVLGLPGVASADPQDVGTLRETVRELDARAKAVRSQAERAAPQVKKESERIVSQVDTQRVAIATRLDLLEMVGRANAVDEQAVGEMSATLQSAQQLLARVESWFRPR